VAELLFSFAPSHCPFGVIGGSSPNQVQIIQWIHAVSPIVSYKLRLHTSDQNMLCSIQLRVIADTKALPLAELEKEGRREGVKWARMTSKVGRD